MEVGVEETGEASVEVAGAVTQVSVVVEAGVEETSVAAAVVVVEAVEISEEAVETLEVEEVATEASTAVDFEVAVAAVLGNREGMWFFLFIFLLISSEIQCVPRKHPGNFGHSDYRQVSR